MSKRDALQMLKAGLYIFGFSVGASVLRMELLLAGHFQMVAILSLPEFFVFWLFLWRLSAPRYENGRSIFRWIQFSGLIKACVVWIVPTVFAAWCVWTYLDLRVLRYSEAMGDFYEAISFFEEDYGVFPGKLGPITDNIIAELRGGPDARINTHHHDYLKDADVRATTDRWGHRFWFRIDGPDPDYPKIIRFTVISCGPNGIYEDGKEDDICYRPGLDIGGQYKELSNASK